MPIIHLSKKYYISILVTLIIVSCGVSKINSSNTTSLDSSNYSTSFLMKDGAILYFIKPIKLISKDKEINVDYTLIKKNEKFNDSIKIGLSLISDIKLETKTIKEIYLDSFQLKHFEILYNDPLGKKFEIRILSSFFYENIKKMNENSSITVKFDSSSENFHFPNKSKKIIKNLMNFMN